MSKYIYVNGELRSIDSFSDQELMHYGVIGMKWGQRKARKKGVEYSYKSMGQRKYEKKLAKQKAAGVKSKKIAKTAEKLDMYKTRDKGREDYASRTNLGKSVAKTILMGPLGVGNYNRMRASGASKLGSYMASNWLASTAGYPISLLYTKHRENASAKRYNRMRNK